MTLTETIDGVTEQAVQWLATLPMLKDPDRWSFHQNTDGFAIHDDVEKEAICTVRVEDREMEPLGHVPVVVMQCMDGLCSTMSGKAAARGLLFDMLTTKVTPALRARGAV